jgi:hypothetical protein
MRPEAGKDVELTFRRAGYKDKTIKVSSLTSANMQVTLDKKTARAPRRTAAKKPKKKSSSGPSWPGPTRSRTPTEVLDPWD